VERFLSRASSAVLPLPQAEDRASGFGQSQPDRNGSPAPGFFAALRPLGCLGGRVLVCEGPGNSLVVLDLHAARERILATRLARERPGATTAPLLGAALAMPSGLEARTRQRTEELERVGLHLEPFGPGALRLLTVPQALLAHRPQVLVEAAVEALEQGLGPAQVRGALACAAAEEGRVPSDAELRSLLGELEDSDAGLPVKHGRVVLQETPLLTLLP